MRGMNCLYNNTYINLQLYNSIFSKRDIIFAVHTKQPCIWYLSACHINFNFSTLYIPNQENKLHRF